MDWGAIATIVVTVLGAASWVVMAITSLKSEVHSLNQTVKSEHKMLWTKIDRHEERLTDHGDRITKLEARGA